MTDKFEIDIIELPKVKKFLEVRGNETNNQKLLTWLKFLINPESVGVAEVEENEEVKKAQEELEKLKRDEIESWYALRREGAVVDERLRLSYATRKGIEQGISQGSKKEKIEIAKKLLLKGENIKYINEITNLSYDEIEKIEDELKHTANKEN